MPLVFKLDCTLESSGQFLELLITGIGYRLGIRIFKSFLGYSKVQSTLRTTDRSNKSIHNIEDRLLTQTIKLQNLMLLCFNKLPVTAR